MEVEMGTKRAFALERHRQRLLDELLTYTVEMIRAGAWTNGKPVDLGGLT